MRRRPAGHRGDALPATTCCRLPEPTCSAGSAGRPRRWPSTAARSSSRRGRPIGRSSSRRCSRVAGDTKLFPWRARSLLSGRFLGARALYAMAYGEISSSLYYALGITAVYALSLTPVVFAAAGFLFALAAAAYAEGGATIPEPGGASAYRPAGVQRPRGVHRRVGDRARLRARDLALGALPAVLLRRRAGAVRLVPRPARPGDGCARSRSSSSSRSSACCGGTDAYTIGVVVAALDLVVQVGIAVFGLVLLFSVDALKNSIDLGTVPTWNSVAFALPIAMIGYTGLEKVGSLAGVREESREEPARQRPHVGLHGRDRLQRGCDRGRVGVPGAPGRAARTAARRSWPRRWVDTPMLGLAHAIGEKGPSWVETRAPHRRRLHRVHDPPAWPSRPASRAAPGWPRRWGATRSSRRSSAARAGVCWPRRRRSSPSRSSRSASSSSARSTPTRRR